MSTLSTFYLSVVENVVEKLKEQFHEEKKDDSFLIQLKQLWESKIMQSGAVRAQIQRESSLHLTETHAHPPIHNLNVPCEATEEYHAYRTQMLFPQMPIQIPSMHTPLQGFPEPVMYQYRPQYSNDFCMPDPKVGINMNIATPVPFMQQPSSWMIQRPPGVNVNTEYDEGNDAAASAMSNSSVTRDFFALSPRKRRREDVCLAYLGGSYIPQEDGGGDFPLVDSNAYYKRQCVQADTVNETKTDVNEEDEAPLNEDDDSGELDDIEPDLEESNTSNFILTQFDKVSRTKNRWKCTLKSGVMHLNSRDILFSKGVGEFEF